MSSVLIFICIASTLVSQICFAAEMVGKLSLQAALERSGGNRSELEAALRTVKSNDTEYLISHASQYDLVNLTAGMIIENMTYARKVHGALPYLGEKLDDEMWREWVLPHRVLEEDVELWRKDLYDRLQPVVRGKKTVREAVGAVHGWLMTGDAGQPAQVRFGGSEDRYKTPVQMFLHRPGEALVPRGGRGGGTGDAGGAGKPGRAAGGACVRPPQVRDRAVRRS
jgi:hypothetical protein